MDLWKMELWAMENGLTDTFLHFLIMGKDNLNDRFLFF